MVLKSSTKSATAIKICLQVSLLILSEGNKLTSIPLEVVSLCKIEPINGILVYLLLILNKFHTSFYILIVNFEQVNTSWDISSFLQ